MRRVLLLCGLLWVPAARAHDLGVEVSGAFTRSSATNPRVGALGVGVSGAYDFNDAWSLTGLLLYTRDLGTRTADTSSPGSNVFLLNLGVLWLPTEQWMFMLAAQGSPPTAQQNATTVQTRSGAQVDVVLNSRNWNVGGQLNGAWSSGGLGRWEHTVDVGLSATRFSVFQKAVLPDTPRAQQLAQACAGGSSAAVCDLVEGSTTPLLQARLSAGYTATLWRDTDVGVDGAVFLYDRNPAAVGYFSLVAFGQTELGTGVPVLPLLVTGRLHVARGFGPVRVKLAYQYGAYTGGLGALHVATARVTVKVSSAWRVGVTLTGQADGQAGFLTNGGLQLLAGVTRVW